MVGFEGWIPGSGCKKIQGGSLERVLQEAQSCELGQSERSHDSLCPLAGAAAPGALCTGSHWTGPGLQGWAGPLAPPGLAAHNGYPPLTHPGSTAMRRGLVIRGI